jgi:hypothetical protein
MLQKDIENFSTNLQKRGFLGGPKILYRSNVPGQFSANADPNLLGQNDMGLDFQTKSEKIRKTLHGIGKSNAQGKTPFISHIKGLLANYDQMMSQPMTVDEYEKVMADIQSLDKGVRTAYGEIAAKEVLSGNPIQEAWDNTSMLSLADMFHLGVKVKEDMEESHQTNKNLRTGLVGKALFNKAYPYLANKSDNRAEKSEKDWVATYEDGLDNKDAWQIMDRISETDSQHELKACLQVLSKQGQIDWYDRRIWRALERFQHTIKFRESDEDDANAFRTKLNRACGIIWDNDFFRDTDRTNSNSYQSEKGNYKEEVTANMTVMDNIIQSMIWEKMAGGKVERQHFEAYVEGAIDAGKSNPQSVFWYILMGAHLGLLNIDRINYLDGEKLNMYPPIEYFYNKKPTLNEIHALAHMFLPTKGGKIPPDEFMEWFLSHVMTDTYVRQRTMKSASEGKWDHDWAEVNLSIGTVNTVQSTAITRYGQPHLPATAFPNALTGQITFITNLTQNKNEFKKNPKLFEDELKRHLSFSAFYNAVIGGKLQGKTKNEYYALTEKEMDDSPRLGTTTLYGNTTQGRDLTARELMDRSNTIIRSLHPILSFIGKPLTDEQAKVYTKNIISTLGNVYEEAQKPAPQTAEELLENLDIVINAIIKKDKSAMRRVIAASNKIYLEDHDGKAKGAIPYEVGRKWRDTYQQKVGKAATQSRGAYALDYDDFKMTV